MSSIRIARRRRGPAAAFGLNSRRGVSTDSDRSSARKTAAAAAMVAHDRAIKRAEDEASRQNEPRGKSVHTATARRKAPAVAGEDGRSDAAGHRLGAAQCRRRRIQRRLRRRWSPPRRQRLAPANPAPSELVVAGQTVQIASPDQVNELDLAAQDSAATASNTMPAAAAASGPATNNVPAPASKSDSCLRRHGRNYQRAKWAAPRGSRKCWRRSAARSRRAPRPGS